jgi:hypothetical protein
MFVLPFALLSALAFTYYGLRCILSLEARQEYRRYGMSNLRVLNGSLQLLGAGGVMIGLLVPPIGMVASGGLCVMMLLGVSTRIRLRDAKRLMIPAASLAALNALLFVLFWLVV